MRRLTRTLLVGALVVAVVAISAAPAGAKGNGNTQISGEAIPADDCGGETSLFTFEMKGSLVGCWYTDDFEVVQETPSGVYQERGTETFVGDLVVDGQVVASGSFSTTYKFTAKFAGEPDFEEIHGRCQHPIVAGSGTGDFEGATGRVDFKDDVDTGQFFYRGHIKLVS